MTGGAFCHHFLLSCFCALRGVSTSTGFGHPRISFTYALFCFVVYCSPLRRARCCRCCRIPICSISLYLRAPSVPMAISLSGAQG